MKQQTAPCVGRCSTTYGDMVCRGCKRQVAEINHWGMMSDEEQLVVWQRLADLTLPTVLKFFEIDSPAQFEEALRFHQIRINEGADPNYRVVALLARQAEYHTWETLHLLGLRLKVELTPDIDLREFWTQMDRHLWNKGLSQLSP